MSDELDARRAAAAGMLGGDEETFRELLQSIVDVARTIFGAQASSIFLLDEEADQLVFEAVSGKGEDSLIGTRFPSSTGIAGFALVTRQPLVVDDLDSDPRFARDRARETGYVPTSIVASPLLHDERALGVLSVLDRAPDRPFGLAELELLSRFSTQAAIGLDLLLRARRARAGLDGEGSGGLVARIASLLDDADDDERADACSSRSSASSHPGAREPAPPRDGPRGRGGRSGPAGPAERNRTVGERCSRAPLSCHRPSRPAREGAGRSGSSADVDLADVDGADVHRADVHRADIHRTDVHGTDVDGTDVHLVALEVLDVDLVGRSATSSAPSTSIFSRSSDIVRLLSANAQDEHLTHPTCGWAEIFPHFWCGLQRS